MELIKLYEIVMPALIAAIIITTMHVPLGIEVLKRGIIFIDLAIAQIAGFGVLVSKYYFHDIEYEFFMVQIFALTFAISGALFFRLIEKKAPNLQEAIIGSTFIIFSSLTMLLLVNDSHGGKEVEAILAGQLLWVTYEQIFFALCAFAALLYLWFFKRDFTNFYVIFAIAVTISVQVIGVYLVFASLVIPAITLKLISKQSSIKFGYLISLLSIVSGLAISILTDLPTGPVIVLSYALIGILVVAVRNARLSN